MELLLGVALKTISNYLDHIFAHTSRSSLLGAESSLRSRRFTPRPGWQENGGSTPSPDPTFDLECSS